MKLMLDPISDLEFDIRREYAMDFFDNDIESADCRKMQMVIECYKYKIDSYIDQYGEYTEMPAEELIKYENLVLKLQKLLPKYNELISQSRKNQITQYNIRDKKEISNDIQELSDIANITKPGSVRFDSHAIQNGKHRLVQCCAFNEIDVTQIELDQRKVSALDYGRALFESFVNSVFELDDSKQLCESALQSLSQKFKQPKSILKRNDTKISQLNPLFIEWQETESDDDFDFFMPNLTLSSSFHENAK